MRLPIPCFDYAGNATRPPSLFDTMLAATTPIARSPLAKCVILALATGAHYVSLRAPNARPTKDDKVYKGQLFEYTVHALSLASKTTVMFFLLSECATILALRFPDAPYAQTVAAAMLPKDSSRAASLDVLSTISLRFALGVSLMFASGALRMWCYRTLGPLFTYEVAIKPTHKLVTSGPYTFVRHPSYTAVGLMMVGAITCVSAPQGYANYSGFSSTALGGTWLWTWYVLSAFSLLSVVKRGRVEDDALKARFGEEWNTYRDRVPYKFIPGLV
ncbi:hypothetical protein PUNSTDRAFT_134381 [Punctularia strigosozonata HHB-11173 SS5]|uniref:uncharacterized protein n=1 Tax=Punctularia strigosozonata (strain HHB-11173) TaxID=741275 RepID=UPI0004417306|nr:uncharacterized protein PUNSTDRAFT_134381 [Punctularia strigosozonata HHB-11173 SS5]EIN09218.1 hypothetical protein PUNSTDRAFT_134381 [Punctularia strigosozonata HHB-11173 SS5]